eukprot:g1851.t1
MAGGSGSAVENPLDTTHDFKVGLFTILMIAIVFCTLIFETVEHAVQTLTSTHKEIHESIYHDVLVRIKDELMILGLISFILVFIEESLQLGNADLHTFHFAHLMVFMIACTYAIQGGAIIYYTKWTRYRWRLAEHEVRMAVPSYVRRRSPSALGRRIDTWLRKKSSANLSDFDLESGASDAGRRPSSLTVVQTPYVGLCCAVRVFHRLWDNLHFFYNKQSYMARFRVVRRMFAAMYLENRHEGATGFASTGDSARRADFDFAVYLTLCLRRNAVELLELRKTSWIAFSAIIFLNWVRYSVWLEVSDSTTYDESDMYLANDNAWVLATFLVSIGLLVLLAQIMMLIMIEDGMNSLLYLHGPELLLKDRTRDWRRRYVTGKAFLEVLELLLRATKRKDRIDARNMTVGSPNRNAKRRKKKVEKGGDYTKHMQKKKSVSWAREDENPKRESEEVLATSSSSSPTIAVFEIGSNVRILKAGSQQGKAGEVIDPHWHGRVKIEMFGTREIKSYLAGELEVIHDARLLSALKEGTLHVGDDVRVIKKGTQTGKIGTVTDPHWNGRVKLRMYDSGATKSYLPNEIEIVRVHSSPTLGRRQKKNSPKHADNRGDGVEDGASKSDPPPPHRSQHLSGSHHQHHHHHHHHRDALDAYYATQAKGCASFFFQCFRLIVTGHEHDGHTHSTPRGFEHIEWRHRGFCCKSDEGTFRVIQGLSLLQALYALWSLLYLAELITVSDASPSVTLVVVFALSTFALLAAMSFGTMPALFERYTLLQAWAAPNFELIDDTKYRIKSRESSIIELIKRFRRMVETTHIDKSGMRQIFDDLDIDKSGRLDRKEIACLLFDMFGSIERARLAALVKLFDPLAKGCTFEMFVKVLYDGNSTEIGKSFALRETIRLSRKGSSELRELDENLESMLEVDGATTLAPPDKRPAATPMGSGVELVDMSSGKEVEDSAV